MTIKQFLFLFCLVSHFFTTALTSYDAYRLLGITPSASPAEITRAYRKLALTYHPDRNPGNEAWATRMMQNINRARDILTQKTSSPEYTLNKGVSIAFVSLVGGSIVYLVYIARKPIAYYDGGVLVRWMIAWNKFRAFCRANYKADKKTTHIIFSSTKDAIACFNAALDEEITDALLVHHAKITGAHKTPEFAEFDSRSPRTFLGLIKKLNYDQRMAEFMRSRMTQQEISALRTTYTVTIDEAAIAAQVPTVVML